MNAPRLDARWTPPEVARPAPGPRAPWILITAGALGAAVVVAAGLGAVSISPTEVVMGLLSPLGVEADPFLTEVLWAIRLPRVALAVLAGGALATAGALMQGLFRNPLADPGLVGVSGGAALAAASVIALGGAAMAPWLPAAAFLGGAAATAVAYKLSAVRGRTSVATLLLAGIALNAITGAGTGLTMYLSDDAQLRSITFWLLGGLGEAAWEGLVVAGPMMLISMVLALLLARPLDALLLGEAEAGWLGIPVQRIKGVTIGLCALMVGAAVALCGLVGFVGLVVPHLARLAVGPRHRLLLPMSALLGAALLVLADTVARVALAPAEIPVGLVTSLIGGPFFLALLIRARERMP